MKQSLDCKAKNLICLWVSLLTLLFFCVGCSLLDGQSILSTNSGMTTIPSEQAIFTLTPHLTVSTLSASGNGVKTPSVQPEPNVTKEPENISLEIWMPEQFDPENTDKGGELLQALFDEFMDENPLVTISVRLKSTAGDSSLLNSLSAASNAAPDAIPSLAIIPRNDMENAIQRELISPIETKLFDQPETWYSYARQSAAFNNLVYGIPIAGDALILAYRGSKTGSLLTSWEQISGLGMPIAFVPSSTTALFPTFVYNSMGGTFNNDQGQIVLDQEKLTEALQFFMDGSQKNVFPASLAQTTDQTQNWQLFSSGSVNMIIAAYSTYRGNQKSDIAAIPIPPITERNEYPLASTWNIVITEKDSSIVPLATELAEKIADPVFNDSWTKAAGFFPMRRGEHPAWNDESDIAFLTAGETAILSPGSQTLNKITPIINGAVSEVIRGAASPSTAAQNAMNSLK